MHISNELFASLFLSNGYFNFKYTSTYFQDSATKEGETGKDIRKEKEANFIEEAYLLKVLTIFKIFGQRFLCAGS